MDFVNILTNPLEYNRKHQRFANTFEIWEEAGAGACRLHPERPLQNIRRYIALPQLLHRIQSYCQMNAQYMYHAEGQKSDRHRVYHLLHS